MTDRRCARLRKWDIRTRRAYDAGVIEGMDCWYVGYPRPFDPDEGYDAPFDLNFYWRPGDRLEQYYRNSQIARQRGAVDGYDQAKLNQEDAEAEDRLVTEVEEGMAQLESFLRAA